jgi:hypothetical protein
MIGNAQTAVEREQYVQKLLALLQTPAFGALTQRPEFPAVEFFKWIMNEVNFRQINSLMGALTMNQAIRQQGQEMGVPQGDMASFQQAMNNMQMAAIPEFANMLANQRAAGEIPSATTFRDEVVAEDNEMI